MPDFLNFLQFHAHRLIFNTSRFEKYDLERDLLPVPLTYRQPVFDKRDAIRNRKHAISVRGK